MDDERLKIACDALLEQIAQQAKAHAVVTANLQVELVLARRRLAELEPKPVLKEVANT